MIAEQRGHGLFFVSREAGADFGGGAQAACQGDQIAWGGDALAHTIDKAFEIASFFQSFCQPCL